MTTCKTLLVLLGAYAVPILGLTVAYEPPVVSNFFLWLV